MSLTAHLATARLVRPALMAAALIAASVSILALLLHVAGWLPMYFLVNLLAAPSIALLLIVGVIAHRVDERVVLDRLLTGAWAGLAATCAYDALRYPLVATGMLSYNPFG